MNLQITIIEGTHTTSMYCPPKGVAKLVDRPIGNGITIIFDNNTMEVETVFEKDGELNNEEVKYLCEEMTEFLFQHK